MNLKKNQLLVIFTNFLQVINEAMYSKSVDRKHNFSVLDTLNVH